MSLVPLAQVLTPCLSDGTAVAGLVVPVPVVAHLDHGENAAICQMAIDRGFTSVMYDGPSLALDENIARTREIVAFAHRQGVSVAAELGYVGWSVLRSIRFGHSPCTPRQRLPLQTLSGCRVNSNERNTLCHDGAASLGADPSEVARFARETAVDALAISVANSHLMTRPVATVNQARLHAIQAEAPGLPLVLHGGSGIPTVPRRTLASETSVCKFNIGTQLRMVFADPLRIVSGAPTPPFASVHDLRFSVTARLLPQGLIRKRRPSHTLAA